MPKSYIGNLINDGLLEPFNFLRILGIATKKSFVGPLKVTVDITNRCDMGCIMCWYHSPRGGTYKNNSTFIDMPLKKLQRLFFELKKLKTRTILLCGEGEPLMHPKIKEIITAALDKKLKVEIMTNAFYLSKEFSDFLIKNKVSKVIVSLHSASKESFSRIRPERNPQDFEIIKENLTYLSKNKKNLPRLYISNVISAFNFREAVSLIKLAESLKADKILFKPLMLTSKLPQELKLEKIYLKDSFLRLKKERIQISNNLKSYFKIVSTQFLHLNSPSHPKVVNKLCLMPWINSVIYLPGDVVGCAYAERVILGNIYKESFYDIWKGKNYQKFMTGKYCPQKCLGKAVYPLSF